MNLSHTKCTIIQAYKTKTVKTEQIKSVFTVIYPF